MFISKLYLICALSWTAIITNPQLYPLPTASLTISQQALHHVELGVVLQLEQPAARLPAAGGGGRAPQGPRGERREAEPAAVYSAVPRRTGQGTGGGGWGAGWSCRGCWSGAWVHHLRQERSQHCGRWVRNVRKIRLVIRKIKKLALEVRKLRSENQVCP